MKKRKLPGNENRVPEFSSPESRCCIGGCAALSEIACQGGVNLSSYSSKYRGRENLSPG